MLKISDGVAQFEGLVLPHGFSTMALGNMAYSRGSEDEVNRSAELFYLKTGLDRENRVHMLPQHGTKIVFVDRDNVGQTIECDGLVTRTPGITLSVCPADCLPIIIKSVDESDSFVALIHAGWKGTRDGVVLEALMQMRLMLTLRLDEPLMAYIGPGVGPCCYKPSFFAKRLGAKSDLISENIRQLRECGVEFENIIVSDTCSYCSKDENGSNLFFSHQRAKRMKEREGRFVAAVAISRYDMGLPQEGQAFEGRRLSLETDKDWQRKIECGHCGVQTSINEFERGELLTGYAGDVVAAPIDVLRCPSCRKLLGELDEGASMAKPYVILEQGARFFI